MTPSRTYLATKRVLDIIASAGAMATLWPALVLVSVAIRLDSPGPVLFRQKRLGKRGIEFTLLKFRTMQVGASVEIGVDNVVFNPPNDPRVTAVGRLLRQLSVDELPQLMNVLAGSMSLVGPRPDLPIALTMYTSTQARRLDVLPGLTGLSQVSGRNLLSGPERWDLDAHYAETANLALDLKILASTVWKVIQREGVYAEQ